jgi:hypothetical protein
MYPTVLLIHSWLRWLVIVFGVWAVVDAGRGRSRGRASLFFTIGLDVQLLLGVLLYFALSPITHAALADMAAAMRNSVWRFWAVEHPSLMILAVVFGHVGRMAGGRARAGVSRAALVWFALALLAIAAATPWPFLGHGRPLFRL